VIAELITWVLFIGWAAIRFNISLQRTGLFFMVFFFLLFEVAVLSFKLFHKKVFTKNDTYQIIINNVALYLGSLFLFGYSFARADIAQITIGISIVAALQAILFYFYWKEESFLVRTTAIWSLLLFVLFIAFNWSGFTVTLLWLLTAVAIFVSGFVWKSVATRMAGMVLIGMTLAKLVLLDSLTFSTVQKVISYLILGVLLLVVSFFYQKFREKLFDES
jgi:hypothetical protein